MQELAGAAPSAFFTAMQRKILQHDVSDLLSCHSENFHSENAGTDVGQFKQCHVLNELSIGASVDL